MTRQATPADLPAILRMARRFLSVEGPYRGRIALDEARVAALAEQMLQGEDRSGWLAERDEAVVGMLGLFCFTHPITGERVAAELCWWIEPEARGTRLALDLLRAGEQWARESGATVLEMIAPDERVATLYGRLGYDRTDIHYRKTL